ncbi:hypothetical protein ACR3I8_17820 [Priestia flexa]
MGPYSDCFGASLFWNEIIIYGLNGKNRSVFFIDRVYPVDKVAIYVFQSFKVSQIHLAKLAVYLSVV